MSNLIIRTVCSVDEQHKCGIYALWNNVSNKVYVGQTYRPFKIRWRAHECFLECHYTKLHLCKSYNKHGSSAFEWKIIEFIPNELNKNILQYYNTNNDEYLKDVHKWLDNKERYWIAYYRKLLGVGNVFNTDDGGKGGRSVIGFTNEQMRHMSESARKRFSKPGEKEKQSERITNYFIRLKEDEEKYNEFCRMRSETQKQNHINDPTLKDRMSAGMKKHYEKPGALEHMSKVQKKAQSRKEVREKKRKSMTGIKWSDEAMKNRYTALHNVYKQRHQDLNNVLYLPCLINPKIKTWSTEIKKQVLITLIHGMYELNIRKLDPTTVLQVMKYCGLLSHRKYGYELDSIDKKDRNTYFVIETYNENIEK